MAIRIHIVEGVGRVIADLLTRDQVRGLMKKVMVRVPSTSEGRSRPRGGKEAARTTMGVLRKMISWGIRERLLKRVDNLVAGMEDNLPNRGAYASGVIAERLLAEFGSRAHCSTCSC